MAGKDDDNNKIGKVSRTGSTKGIGATERVGEVDRVKGATGVKGVSAVSGVRGAGSVNGIRFEQREKLLTMVFEEAEKLAAQGVIPKSQKEVVAKAVQMVIDAALVDNSEEKEGSKDKK
jgi:hypothetical protein